MQRIDKEMITDAAVQLFKKHGYNNVTINDICQSCRITKPTFYNYINSKEDLIVDIYDRTINNILREAYHFIEASSHIEQLYIVFSSLISDTLTMGYDLFSQLLISNLNQNRNSFEMRESLTKLCTVIIKKAQEKGEIHNSSSPKLLYQMIAYSFMGFETNWCIQNGGLNFVALFFEGVNALLMIDSRFEGCYKKYLEAFTAVASIQAGKNIIEAEPIEK